VPGIASRPLDNGKHRSAIHAIHFIAGNGHKPA
jgi:hypothetical protein